MADQARSSFMQTLGRLAPYVGPVIVVIVLAAVIYAIRGFLDKVDLNDVAAAITATPTNRILDSFGAVALASAPFLFP